MFLHNKFWYFKILGYICTDLLVLVLLNFWIGVIGIGVVRDSFRNTFKPELEQGAHWVGLAFIKKNSEWFRWTCYFFAFKRFSGNGTLKLYFIRYFYFLTHFPDINLAKVKTFKFRFVTLIFENKNYIYLLLFLLHFANFETQDFWNLIPFVKRSFKKHTREEVIYIVGMCEKNNKHVCLSNVSA